MSYVGRTPNMHPDRLCGCSRASRHGKSFVEWWGCVRNCGEGSFGVMGIMSQLSGREATGLWWKNMSGIRDTHPRRCNSDCFNIPCGLAAGFLIGHIVLSQTTGTEFPLSVGCLALF